jgi:GNAT superfamily N-acetyltransferase
MLDLRRVAQLEETRLRIGMAEVSHAFIEIGHGVATRGDKGTWVNSAVAIGMGTPVTPEDIDRVIAFHEEVGAEPRVEACPFADKSLLTALAARSFTLAGFDNVFFRALTPGETFTPLHAPPADLTIREVDPRSPEQVRTFALTVTTGFAPPGSPRQQAAIDLVERCCHHPRTRNYTAFIGDTPAAAGSLELHGEIAALFGLSTLKDFRGRGIQQSLIAARLTAAREAGCAVATISSAPGNDTERNARRAGFQVAYTRAFMSRPGPGLTPVNM